MLEFSILLAAAAAQNPRLPEMLDSREVLQPSAIASENDQSVVLWVDSATQQVFCSATDGRAMNWATPIRIDDDLSGAAKFVSPRCLAVTDQVAYAVWRDQRNGLADAYWARSSDRGLSWTFPQRLDDGYAVGTQAVTDVQIVASETYLYVAMTVERPGGGEDVFMASSMDYGITWNPTLQANSSSADCDATAIDCEGINAFVTWADDRNVPGMDDLFLRMTHNGGLSWMMTMPEQQIDPNGPGVGNVESEHIQIVSGMTGLAVAWLEDQTPTSPQDEELHVLYSPDGGHMWPFPDAILGSGADVENPAIAFDNATLVIAFEDDRSGSDQVYAQVSKDFTLSWTEHQLSSQGGALPAVCGFGELWGLTYLEGGTTQTPSFVASRDSALNFLPAVDLQNYPTANGEAAALYLNHRYENFAVTWLDDRNGSNQLFAGGARAQSLAAISPTFAPGDPIHFEASHFPLADFNTPFAVLVSSGMGSYKLPFGDGRNTGLLNNPYQPLYLAQLSGNLNIDGSGATSVLTVPNTPGATWYAVGVAYLTSHTAVYLQRLTDVVSIAVQ